MDEPKRRGKLSSRGRGHNAAVLWSAERVRSHAARVPDSPRIVDAPVARPACPSFASSALILIALTARATAGRILGPPGPAIPNANTALRKKLATVMQMMSRPSGIRPGRAAPQSSPRAARAP